MYAFIKTVRKADRTRRYTIEITNAGWEVRADEDSELLRHVCYDDWHRVERAERSMIEELEALKQDGWTEERALQPTNR